MQAAISLVGQRSRSRIAPFRLHRPASVEDAVELSARAEGSAAYMAGGLDLIGAMKGGAKPAEVVHLGRIAALGRIAPTAEGVSIGACVTHEELASHPLLQARTPDVVREWRTLGSPRVRCTGTLGGNIMAGNPAYDAAPILMALGARLLMARPGNERIAVDVAGPAAPEGLLTRVEIPGRDRARLIYERSLRPAVGLALGLHFREGLVARAVVGIGCAYPRPCAWPIELARPIDLAQLAARADKFSASFAANLPMPKHDWQAGAVFRRRMIQALLRRLLLRAGELAC